MGTRRIIHAEHACGRAAAGRVFRLEEALERRLLGCRQSHGDRVSEDDVEGLPE